MESKKFEMKTPEVKITWIRNIHTLITTQGTMGASILRSAGEGVTVNRIDIGGGDGEKNRKNPKQHKK